VLVTGASGWLGGRLVEMLINRGYNVRGLDIRNAEKLSTLKKYEHIQGDLTVLDNVRRACLGVDTIFHVAAISELKRGTHLLSLLRCEIISLDLLSILLGSNQNLFELVNVNGTKNVIDAACECGVQRLVYVRSLLFRCVCFFDEGGERRF
jgi:nucleoside-diphosphate-sugar epimerase